MATSFFRMARSFSGFRSKAIERLFDAWVRKAVPMLRRLSSLSAPDATALIGLVGMLDLDHVGAKDGELIGRERSGQNVGDVDHPDSLERSRRRAPCRCFRLCSV